MKTKKLLWLLVTLTVIAANKAMAIGYNAANEQLSGIGIAEVHTWQARISFDQGECTTPVCQALGGGQTELVGVVQQMNESTCILRSTDESPLELTGSCAASSPNQDNYCGSNSITPAPPSGCPDGTDTSVPTILALNVTEGNPVPPSFAPAGPVSFLASWDIDTAVNGKVMGGYYLIGTGIMGATIINFLDFDKRVLVSAQGPISNVPVACWRDPATVSEADYVACGGAGVTVFSASGMDYITADDTQLGGGKAVPLPTFAAAALALGLVGVTVLTGRRQLR